MVVIVANVVVVLWCYRSQEGRKRRWKLSRKEARRETRTEAEGSRNGDGTETERSRSVTGNGEE